MRSVEFHVQISHRIRSILTKDVTKRNRCEHCDCYQAVRTRSAVNSKACSHPQAPICNCCQRRSFCQRLCDCDSLRSLKLITARSCCETQRGTRGVPTMANECRPFASTCIHLCVHLELELTLCDTQVYRAPLSLSVCSVVPLCLTVAICLAYICTCMSIVTYIVVIGRSSIRIYRITYI